MTDEQLAQIKARVDAATPGPWVTGGGDWVYIAMNDPDEGYRDWNPNVNGPFDADYPRAQQERDGDFMAHARTDIPLLLAEVERLRPFRRVLKEMVDEMGEPWWDVGDQCLFCGRLKPGPHRDDCTWRLAEDLIYTPQQPAQGSGEELRT